MTQAVAETETMTQAADEADANSYSLQLTESDEDFAAQQLGEQDVHGAIRRLRDWVLQNSQIKCCTSDTFLLSFLRLTRFDEKKAGKALQDHVTMRVSLPYSELFHKQPKLLPGAEKALDLGIALVLPGRARDGSRVVVSRTGLLGRPAPRDITVMDGQQAGILSIDLLQSDPVLQVRGVTIVVDHTGSGLLSFIHHNTPQIRRLTSALATNSHYRLVAIKQLDAPLLVRGMIAFMKTILRKDQISKVKCIKITEAVQAIPPETLPTELGGTAGSYEQLAKRWSLYVKRNLHQLDWLASFEASAIP